MNTSRSYIRFLAVTLATTLAILGASCSLPGKAPVTAKQTYLLQDRGLQHGGQSGTSLATEARHCLSLRVTTPASAPGYASTRMVYVKQAPRLDYFAYHEWVDTPARMIQTLMETRLDSSGLFGTVVSGSSDVRTDLRLDAELQKLQQDFSGNGSTLSLEIKVAVVEMSGRSLLASKSFSYTETAGVDPASGVAAADRAAQQFLADLTTFVAEAISALECGP